MRPVWNQSTPLDDFYCSHDKLVTHCAAASFMTAITELVCVTRSKIQSTMQRLRRTEEKQRNKLVSQITSFEFPINTTGKLRSFKTPRHFRTKPDVFVSSTNSLKRYETHTEEIIHTSEDRNSRTLSSEDKRSSS